MDRVDLLIIVLLIFAVFRGSKYGLLQLGLSTLGFLIGILVGSELVKLFTEKSSISSTQRLVLVLLVEFGLGLLLSFIGEYAGRILSRKLHVIHLHKFNQAFGIVFEVVSVLLICWFVASGLSNTSLFSLGYFIRRSTIIQEMDKILPPPPDLLANAEKFISPNGFPNVFVGVEPQLDTGTPTGTVSESVVNSAENSVVKIEGSGCGGIVEGSGFVVKPGVVVTNAHVVAGIDDPYVVDSYGNHLATTVWFDPNIDLAVLRVPNLTDSPIDLASNNLANNSGAVALGYPEGGPLTVSNAEILDTVNAQGRNIYDQGLVTRQIYEIQAIIEPGNSGGPLIGSQGTVEGIVFAKSVIQSNVGYSLTISQVKPSILRAENLTTKVSVGQCAD